MTYEQQKFMIILKIVYKQNEVVLKNLLYAVVLYTLI